MVPRKESGLLRDGHLEGYAEADDNSGLRWELRAGWQHEQARSRFFLTK